MLLLYLSMLDDIDKIDFETIYKKYSASVFRKIFAILRTPSDSEDAAQETWIKVLKNMELLRGKDERVVLSYIMRVAKNEAISRIRERKKENVLFSEIDGADIPDDSEFFDICSKINEETIIKCIEALDEIYSSVLLYYYLHHYTVREIASLLSLKEITVYKRIERGRKKLIELLERSGICDRE